MDKNLAHILSETCSALRSFTGASPEFDKMSDGEQRNWLLLERAIYDQLTHYRLRAAHKNAAAKTNHF